MLWVIAEAKELFPVSNGFKGEDGFMLSALFGATGGFMTLVYGLNNIDFYYDDSKFSYILTSLSRVVISMLSGMVLFIMIKSNIALGFLESVSDKNPFVYLVFATLAGFSEAFVPNILLGLEKSKK